ncbi:hypothetical protein D3C73_842860 [compost metagenome]
MAPLRVRLPLPVLVRPLLPVSSPDRVSAPVLAVVRPAPRMMALLRLIVPGADSVEAPVTLIVPVLRAWLLPSATVPPLSVVAPA